MTGCYDVANDIPDLQALRSSSLMLRRLANDDAAPVRSSPQELRTRSRYTIRSSESRSVLE